MALFKVFLPKWQADKKFRILSILAFFGAVVLLFYAFPFLKNLFLPAKPVTLPPQPVNVLELHFQNAGLETILPGRVNALEQAHIRPQVNGVIVSRDFHQGADVEKGQVLYKIYAVPYQAAVDQAQGTYMEAKALHLRAEVQLKRYGPLHQAHAVSDQAYDNAVADEEQTRGQLLQAEGALHLAEVNLDYSTVRSPISGRIGRMIYTPGTLVTANQTDDIALVTRLDPIYVDVNLAAEELLRFRREIAEGRIKAAGENAASVRLELPDGSDYKQEGRLELSEVTVDPSTGTLVMRAQFPNPQHLLLPGMFAQAHIHEGADPHALLVPEGAVQRSSNGAPFVMLATKDNHAKMQPITLGMRVGSDFVAKTGLNDGDLLIVSGLVKIHPGDPVMPMPIRPSGDHASEKKA
ncbi:acriflavin resistance efflux transporter [Lasius niger]|uniref:Acriflavin resistance efflux transporter n=1 Tax=Lasius niger TaxID=67767 RepID=A0A0J7L0I2_LASNI|nr:acriflavin resistance efflux transporter [Lasius niger]